MTKVIRNIIRNPARHSDERVPHKPYVPEYQRLSREPVHVNIPNVSGQTVFAEQMIMDGNVVYEDDYANEAQSESSEPSSVSSPPSAEVAGDDALIAPGECILMIKNIVIEKGSIEKIRTVITDIVYGTHPGFQNANLAPEDFIVLKRMDIEFGVLIK